MNPHISSPDELISGGIIPIMEIRTGQAMRVRGSCPEGNSDIHLLRAIFKRYDWRDPAIVNVRRVCQL